MKTPWGNAQTVRPLSEGILSITTASHGGIKLDRKRNAMVPKYMRLPGGWYEEDCDWAIPATVFPLSFASSLDAAEKSLRNWNPDAWEQFYGRTLDRSESFIKDERGFQEDNKNNYVIISALGVETVDKGRVVEYCASLGGKRGEGASLIYGTISPEEYEKRGRFGYVLSPEQVKECQND